MRVTLFLMLFTLIYCEEFDGDGDWVEKTKKYTEKAKAILDAISVANNVDLAASTFCPVVAPVSTGLEVLITTFSSGIEAIERAVKEYEEGRISEDEFHMVVQELFKLTLATKFSITALLESLPGPMAAPFKLVSKLVKVPVPESDPREYIEKVFETTHPAGMLGAFNCTIS